MTVTETLHGIRQSSVQHDQSVGQKLGERDVLGVDGVGPAELVCDLPRDVLQHAVAEHSTPQRAHVVQLSLRVVLGQLTAAYGSVEE